MRKAYYPRVRIITKGQFNNLLCKQIIEPLSIASHPYGYKGIVCTDAAIELLGKRVVIQHYNSRNNLYNCTECALTVSKLWLTVPNWMLRRNYETILKEYNKDK